jgi:hypothetical protein
MPFTNRNLIKFCCFRTVVVFEPERSMSSTNRNHRNLGSMSFLNRNLIKYISYRFRAGTLESMYVLFEPEHYKVLLFSNRNVVLMSFTNRNHRNLESMSFLNRNLRKYVAYEPEPLNLNNLESMSFTNRNHRNLGNMSFLNRNHRNLGSMSFLNRNLRKYVVFEPEP